MKKLIGAVLLVATLWVLAAWRAGVFLSEAGTIAASLEDPGIDDIPGTVRIEWLEHSAHMPMQEEPERYAAAVLGFLEEVVASERAEAAAEVARAEDR